MKDSIQLRLNATSQAPETVEFFEKLSQAEPDFKATITPALALVIVTSFGGKNRTASQAQVSKLSGAIIRNEWKYNGVPIIFSKDGELIDGRHRCLAVMHSNTPIEVKVTGGIELDVIDTIDIESKARTTADSLDILSGTKNTAIKAYVCTALKKYETVGKFAKYSPTNIEVIEVVKEYSDVIDTAYITAKEIFSNVTSLTPTPFNVKKLALLLSFFKIYYPGLYEDALVNAEEMVLGEKIQPEGKAFGKALHDLFKKPVKGTRTFGDNKLVGTFLEVFAADSKGELKYDGKIISDVHIFDTSSKQFPKL